MNQTNKKPSLLIRRPTGKSFKITYEHSSYSFQDILSQIKWVTQSQFKVPQDCQIFYLYGEPLSLKSLKFLLQSSHLHSTLQGNIIHALDKYKINLDKINITFFYQIKNTKISINVNSNSKIKDVLSQNQKLQNLSNLYFIYAGKCVNIQNSFRQQLIQNYSLIDIIEISTYDQNKIRKIKINKKNSLFQELVKTENIINFERKTIIEQQNVQLRSQRSFQSGSNSIESGPTGRFKSLTSSNNALTQLTTDTNLNCNNKQIRISDVKRNIRTSKNSIRVSAKQSLVDIEGIGQSSDQSDINFDKLNSDEERQSGDENQSKEEKKDNIQDPQSPTKFINSLSKQFNDNSNRGQFFQSPEKIKVLKDPSINSTNNHNLTGFLAQKFSGSKVGIGKTQAGITGRQVKQILDQTRNRYRKQHMSIRRSKINVANNEFNLRQDIEKCQSQIVSYLNDEDCRTQQGSAVVQNPDLQQEPIYGYDPWKQDDQNEGEVSSQLINSQQNVQQTISDFNIQQNSKLDRNKSQSLNENFNQINNQKRGNIKNNQLDSWKNYSNQQIIQQESLLQDTVRSKQF